MREDTEERAIEGLGSGARAAGVDAAKASRQGFGRRHACCVSTRREPRPIITLIRSATNTTALADVLVGLGRRLGAWLRARRPRGVGRLGCPQPSWLALAWVVLVPAMLSKAQALLMQQ